MFSNCRERLAFNPLGYYGEHGEGGGGDSHARGGSLRLWNNIKEFPDLSPCTRIATCERSHRYIREFFSEKKSFLERASMY